MHVHPVPRFQGLPGRENSGDEHLVFDPWTAVRNASRPLFISGTGSQPSSESDPGEQGQRKGPVIRFSTCGRLHLVANVEYDLINGGREIRNGASARVQRLRSRLHSSGECGTLHGAVSLPRLCSALCRTGPGTKRCKCLRRPKCATRVSR